MAKGYGGGFTEGMTGVTSGSAMEPSGGRRKKAKQPGGGNGGHTPGSFGCGPGSASVDGVTFEGAAAGTTRNGGNYNEVGGSARVFGKGGKL